MFKVLDKKKNFVTIKMDIDTYNWIKEEINEDISKYEFVFDEPIDASKLIK